MDASRVVFEERDDIAKGLGQFTMLNPARNVTKADDRWNKPNIGIESRSYGKGHV